MKSNLAQTGVLFKNVGPLGLVWGMRSTFKNGVPCRCEGSLWRGTSGLRLRSEGFLCLMTAHKVRLWKFPISKTDQGPGKATESVGTLKCQWAFPFFWTLHWRNPSSWGFTVSSMVPFPHKRASFILKHEAWGISWKWYFYSVDLRQEGYCVEQT